MRQPRRLEPAGCGDPLQLLYDAHYLHKRRHLTPGFEAELERVIALADDPPVAA